MTKSIKLAILLFGVISFASCAKTGTGCYDFSNTEKVETKKPDYKNNYKDSKIVFTTRKC